jgi:hypothetical protein
VGAALSLLFPLNPAVPYGFLMSEEWSGDPPHSALKQIKKTQSAGVNLLIASFLSIFDEPSMLIDFS